MRGSALALVLVVACAGRDDVNTTGTLDGTSGRNGGDAGTGSGGSAGGSGSGGGGEGGAGAAPATGGSGGCPAGSALCSGVCTSLNTPYDCGSCFAACTDSAVCEDGRCRAPTCEEVECGRHIFDDPNRIHCTDDGCAECRDDADCPGPTRTACAFGTCSECNDELDCEAGRFCRRTAASSVSRCVQCSEDSDCRENPAGTRCNPAGECVPACATDLDCTGSTSPACGIEVGHCVACKQDGHCPPSAPRCRLGNSEANNRCVACSTDADCLLLPAFPSYCSSGGECTRCTLDAHCTDPGRPYCVEDACVSCRDDAGCPLEAPFCDPMTRACHGGCDVFGCTAGDATYGTCFESGKCGCETAHDCPDPRLPRCDRFRFVCVSE